MNSTSPSAIPLRMKTWARAAAILRARNLFRSACGRTEVSAPLGWRRWRPGDTVLRSRIGISKSTVDSRFRGNRAPSQRLLSISALCLALTGFNLSATAEDRARHRFLCCDYQGNKVAIVAADGSVEWEFAAQTPQDCWLLPNGNVLFCYRNGAKEVSREKQVVWEYKAPPPAECQSCQP